MSEYTGGQEVFCIISTGITKCRYSYESSENLHIVHRISDNLKFYVSDNNIATSIDELFNKMRKEYESGYCKFKKGDMVVVVSNKDSDGVAIATVEEVFYHKYTAPASYRLKYNFCPNSGWNANAVSEKYLIGINECQEILQDSMNENEE